MEASIAGFAVGLLFGASLFLSGLANPDKIVGTLRLKDFHAMRVITVFILVGMMGAWIMTLTNGPQHHYSIKTASLLSNLIGGSLLGIGFGITGYCPGTGLACAAAGRLDALVTVLGMFVGAGTFILIYPYVMPQLNSVLAYGKKTMPEITGTRPAWWVLPIVGVGTVVLILTKPRRTQTALPGEDAG
ncbi:MAG: YeeE/YedE family protein [Phycisphaerae bacterium]